MQHEKKGSVRDVLMKPEDIHACFNTQLEIISRLEKTNTKMTELNTASEQKYKRVQKSFANAAEMLKKMQADLWFIHSAVKKLNQLSSSEQAAVDKTTAIVQSKTGDVQIEENQNKASEEHKSEDKAEKGTENQGENVKAAEDVKASEGQNAPAENKTEQEAAKEEGAQVKAE